MVDIDLPAVGERDWAPKLNEAMEKLALATGEGGGTGGVSLIPVVTGSEPRPAGPLAVWLGGVNEPDNSIPGDIWVADSAGSVTPDTQAPSVPTGVVVTSVNGNGFTLSWDASTDDRSVTGYEILVDGRVAATTTGVRNATIGGLQPAGTYSIRVRARDAAGNWSGASVAVSVTTSPVGDTSSPSVPTNLMLANLSGTAFTVNWTAASDNVGVTLYEVQVNGTTFGTTPTPTMSIPGRTPGTSYSVRVRARDAAGNWSALSTALGVNTPAADTTAPTAPTGVTASAITTTSATISWSASTDAVGVTGYEVQVNGVVRGTPTATTLALTGLTPNTAHAVRVRARDAGANWSALSSVLNFSTAPLGPPPRHSIFPTPPVQTYTKFNDGGTIRVSNGFYTYQTDTVGWKSVGARFWLPAGQTWPTNTQFFLFTPPLNSPPDLSAPVRTGVLAAATPGQWNEVLWESPYVMTSGIPVWVGYQSTDGAYVSAGRGAFGDSWTGAADGAHVVFMGEPDGALPGRAQFSLNGGPTTMADGPGYGIDIIVEED